MDEFLVVRIPDKYEDLLKIATVYGFFSAKDVAMFMWGKSMGKHIIYKNGKHAYLAHVYPEIFELQHYLEGEI